MGEVIKRAEREHGLPTLEKRYEIPEKRKKNVIKYEWVCPLNLFIFTDVEHRILTLDGKMDCCGKSFTSR